MSKQYVKILFYEECILKRLRFKKSVFFNGRESEREFGYFKCIRILNNKI